MIHAIVPVKSLDRAKGRLAPLLAPHERRAVVLAMLEDVLAALGSASATQVVNVISSDPVVLDVALSLGASRLLDASADLNGALAQAARAAERQGATGVLVLPADVPLVTSADIDALAALVEGAGVVIAPSRDGGTNGLLIHPPLALPFLFGSDSMARHWQAARNLGLPVRLFRHPRFARDVDQPDDLLALVEAPAPSRAAGVARDLQIMSRLCSCAT